MRVPTMRVPITVVFCDVVGFSVHDEKNQKAIISELNREVTYVLYVHLHDIDPERSLICLPTGDGMAIVFVDHGEIDWQHAVLALADRLISWSSNRHRSNNRFKGIRVGIHSGAAPIIADINRRINVCGDAINECQRIMDAAHVNQVLLSAAAQGKYFKDHQPYTDVPFSPENPGMIKGPYTVIAKHDEPINVHILYRQGDEAWGVQEPYPRGPIIGRTGRTRFIVNRLEDLLNQPGREVVICEQSSLSTFAIIEDESAWRSQPNYDQEYSKLAVRQMQLLNQLALSGRADVRLILNPALARHDNLSVARIKALLAWMKRDDILSNPRVSFVESEFEGPNRLLVENSFCIEGYKLRTGSGYDLSIVIHDKDKLALSQTEYMQVFDQAKRAGQSKESVIESLTEATRKNRVKR